MPQELHAKITEVIIRTYNVKSFRLQVPEPIDFNAGQFLCVWLDSEKKLKRYLSISNAPTEKGYLEFTKKITQSDFSVLLDTLKAGDMVKIQYPLGKFTLAAAGDSPVAFLSGGIGITPIRSMCKYAVDKNLGKGLVLIYANRSINDIVFKADFEQMQAEYPGLKVTHVLCEPAPGFRCSVGLIDSQLIKREVPDYAARKFYLCGPPAMVEAMNKLLSRDLALPKENIITENFTGY
ncbi:MAG: FAD-binding oxidoreductase [Candidatus Omnitrophota bacterium]|jgi:ferredoxin-NADP reductase